MSVFTPDASRPSWSMRRHLWEVHLCWSEACTPEDTFARPAAKPSRRGSRTRSPGCGELRESRGILTAQPSRGRVQASGPGRRRPSRPSRVSIGRRSRESPHRGPACPRHVHALLKLDGITPNEEDGSLHSVTERLQEGREAGSAVVRGDVVGGNHGQGRHAKPVHGVVGFMIVAASRCACR